MINPCLENLALRFNLNAIYVLLELLPSCCNYIGFSEQPKRRIHAYILFLFNRMAGDNAEISAETRVTPGHVVSLIKQT